MGRYHNIEVEDNITVTSMGEPSDRRLIVHRRSAGSNRFEIVGTQGKVVVENNKIAHRNSGYDRV